MLVMMQIYKGGDVFLLLFLISVLLMGADKRSADDVDSGLGAAHNQAAYFVLPYLEEIFSESEGFENAKGMAYPVVAFQIVGADMKYLLVDAISLQGRSGFYDEGAIALLSSHYARKYQLWLPEVDFQSEKVVLIRDYSFFQRETRSKSRNLFLRHIPPRVFMPLAHRSTLRSLLFETESTMWLFFLQQMRPNLKPNFYANKIDEIPLYGLSHFVSQHALCALIHNRKLRRRQPACNGLSVQYDQFTILRKKVMPFWTESLKDCPEESLILFLRSKENPQEAYFYVLKDNIIKTERFLEYLKTIHSSAWTDRYLERLCQVAIFLRSGIAFHEKYTSSDSDLEQTDSTPFVWQGWEELDQMHQTVVSFLEEKYHIYAQGQSLDDLEKNYTQSTIWKSLAEAGKVGSHRS